MKKRINYKWTIVLSLIGFILSGIFFFTSSTFFGYIKAIGITIFIFGSIGWSIDKFRPKKLIPFLLVIFYIIVLVLFIFNDMHKMHCLGCSLVTHRNLFTEECKCFCVGCGISAPWYWEKDDSCPLEGMCVGVLK